MSARLEKLYKDKIRKELQKELGLKNIMQVPKLSKVVLNIGVKDAVADSKVLTGIKDILQDITGQAVVITKAKKSIAGFKLREGMPIGAKVTLRKDRMYDFLDRFINLTLPRVKDFRGVKIKMDGNGNYNLGVRDWMVFPEVNYEKVDKVRGLNITIETTASKDEEALALLRHFKMPFHRS